MEDTTGGRVIDEEADRNERGNDEKIDFPVVLQLLPMYAFGFHLLVVPVNPSPHGLDDRGTVLVGPLFGQGPLPPHEFQGCRMLDLRKYLAPRGDRQV